jgi:hypothetical protein
MLNYPRNFDSFVCKSLGHTIHSQLDMLHGNLKINVVDLVVDLFGFMRECNNFAQYDADICQL